MKIPPILSQDGKRKIPDYGTRQGAEALAAIAHAAWLKAGHDVPVEVVEGTPGHPESRWILRFPTLVDGVPVTR